MTPITLHPAFHWACPNCGSVNYERTEMVTRSTCDSAEDREPADVKCKCCGGTFEAKDGRAER